MTKAFLPAITICVLMFTSPRAQTANEFLTNLCQRWQLDAIEIASTGQKAQPDAKRLRNYIQFKPDGTFTSVEDGTPLNGKWKADEIKKEIETSDFDNQNITSPIIFSITAISKTHLAISTSSPSGNQVIMHYVARNEKVKKRR